MDRSLRPELLAAPNWARWAEAALLSRWLAWSIIMVGVMLRLAQYLANRSLWIDEAALALNIIERPYAQLLEPLDRQQTGPIGFLFLLRVAYELFGPSEYALRLVPLLGSVVALLLLYPVARAYLSPRAVPLVLLLFAILDPLIYYASELKQYSTDMACTLLALYGAQLAQARPTPLRLLALGLAGMPLLWISQPAAFVLGGIGLVLGVQALREQDRRRTAMLAAVGGLWLLAFALAYSLALRTIADYDYFHESWSNGFAPTIGEGFLLEDLRWYVMTLFGVFKYPTGLEDYAAGVAVLAALTAGAFLARRQPTRLLLLTLPIALTLLASFLERYPFQARLLFFLVPIFLLLVAEGVERLSAGWRSRWALWALLVAILTVEPAIFSAQHLIAPRRSEELATVLDRVRPQLQPGDTVYVYYGAKDAFDYYAYLRPLPDVQLQFGSRSRDDWAIYLDELNDLQGRERVWLLFSHVYRHSGADERQLFLFELDRIGTQLVEHRATGAAAYLYDLSR